jgi:protein involved in polysaccharide export with SLBB domain
MPALDAPIEGRVDPDTYRVGPGDEFALRYSDLLDPKILRVAPSGELLLPDAGPVAVAGLSLREAQSRVREILRPYVRGKGFVLALHRTRRFRLPVLGEVERPGSVTLQAPARASEAIEAAGGIREEGVRRGIKVARGADTLQVDLVRYERIGDLNANPLVFETDVLFVPARGNRVEILGAVPHPGTYDFIPGDRLTLLTELAGGVLPWASLESAELTRFDERGGPQRRPLRLAGALANVGGSDDLLLDVGDRIFLPSQAHWREGPMIEVVGEVLRPGPYPIAEGTDRVRALIQRAGGYTEFAERGAVRIERQATAAGLDSMLLRLARTGDGVLSESDREWLTLQFRERRAVAAEVGVLLERGDEKGNALLLTGDRIVVPRHRPVVSVQGEVRVPGFVQYRPGRRVEDYVVDAGGYTKSANRNHVRVTVANSGQQVEAREVGTLRPEDVIWVPRKTQRSAWARARDFVAIASQAATVYLVIRQATK